MKPRILLFFLCVLWTSSINLNFCLTLSLMTVLSFILSNALVSFFPCYFIITLIFSQKQFLFQSSFANICFPVGHNNWLLINSWSAQSTKNLRGVTDSLWVWRGCGSCASQRHRKQHSRRFCSSSFAAFNTCFFDKCREAMDSPLGSEVLCSGRSACCFLSQTMIPSCSCGCTPWRRTEIFREAYVNVAGSVSCPILGDFEFLFQLHNSYHSLNRRRWLCDLTWREAVGTHLCWKTLRLASAKWKHSPLLSPKS